jgi:hypothetical protein
MELTLIRNKYGLGSSGLWSEFRAETDLDEQKKGIKWLLE